MTLIDLTIENDDAIEQAKQMLSGVDVEGATRVQLCITDTDPAPETETQAQTEAVETVETDEMADTDGGWTRVPVGAQLPQVEPKTEQWRVLAFVADCDGPVTGATVADGVTTLPGRASTVLSRLYGKGAVARDGSADPYEYRVSAAGMELLERERGE